MHVIKRGAFRVWMTKRGTEESRVHLQVRKGKAALTAEELRGKTSLKGSADCLIEAEVDPDAHAADVDCSRMVTRK